MLSGGKPASRVALATTARAKGNEQARRLDEQQRAEGVLRYVAQGHGAGIDQLEHEQRLLLRRLGVGLDRQRHLEGLGVELAVGDLDVERELGLLLLDQALRRARVLEAQVLDVLAVHDERAGGSLGGGRGGRRRRSR